MADHDTISWGSTRISLSDGSSQHISEGTTTTDVSGGLVANKPYYIYWKPTDPTVFHTIIASDWVTRNVGGYVLVATVTGAASGGKAQTKYAGGLAVDGQDQINASEIVNQDSVTGTEIGTVGSVATTGLRMKMSTAGTGAAGSGSTGAFLRAYTANSVSDITGRWLDIDGDNQAIYFMDGSENNYILSSMSAAGMKFYSGTSATASDGTTRAHYGGSTLTFYNGSGLGAGNELVSLGVGSAQGLNLYGSDTSLTNTSLIRYQSSVGGGWVNRGYQGLWRDGNDLDHLIMYTPNSNVYLISSNAGSSTVDGSTIKLQASTLATPAGWKTHSSSDSGGVYRNHLFPFNNGSGSNIVGDVSPDGTSDEPYNYIGYFQSDTRDGQGTFTFGPTISQIQTYYISLGAGTAADPSLFFDDGTGVYSPADNAVGISAGDSLIAQFDSSGVTIQGALARTAGVEDMWIPAAAMRPTNSNGCAFITDVETTSGRPDLQVLDFDKDSDEFAQFSVAFPKSWNAGTVTFQAYWTSASTNTGTVAWAMSGTCIGDNDTINETYPTPTVATAKAHSGTVEDLNISAVSGAMTIENAADGELTFFQILRDVSADDHSSDARLIGVKINYTTSAATDA